MKKISTLLLCALLLASCSLKEETSALSGDSVSVGGFTFNVLPFRSQEGTKSSIFVPGKDLFKTKSLLFLAYEDGVLDKVNSNYFADVNAFTTDFTNGDVRNFYFLANVADCELSNFGPAKNVWSYNEVNLESEANVKDLVYAVSSYSTFSTTGFPLAGKVEGWIAGTSSNHFDLERKVALIQLKLKDLIKDNIHLTVTGATLHQAANKIRPFGTVPFAAQGDSDIIYGDVEKANDVDKASASDLVTLNDSQEILLYALENMQGDLLPENADPWNKRADNTIGDKASLVTYVDVQCSATTQASTIDELHYKVCLGKDNTSNFDVEGGAQSSLVIDYLSDNINDHDWKQTSEGHDNKPYHFVCSRDTAFVCPGISDEIYVYGVGAHTDKFIEINLDSISIVGSDANAYAVELVQLPSGKAYKFTVASNIVSYPTGAVVKYGMNADMNDARKFKESKIIFQSKDQYNGISNVKDSIIVRNYDAAIFPIEFKYEDGYILARSNNPMGLGLKFSTVVNGGSPTVFTPIDYNYQYTKFALRRGWQRIKYVGEQSATSKMRLNIDITPISPTVARSLGYDPDNEECTGPFFTNGQTFNNGYGCTTNFGPGNVPFSLPDGGTGLVEISPCAADTKGQVWGSEAGVMWEYNKGALIIKVQRRDLSELGKVTISPNNGRSEFTDNQMYLGCPFYVRNAAMLPAENYISKTINNNLNGDTEWANLNLVCLQPGRDLFPRNNRSYYSWTGMSIWLTQQLFNIHYWAVTHSYEYGVHMTINNWTDWPGSDYSREGILY